MGWRFRFWRRIRVLPGVTVNLSKSSTSVSVGPRGSKVTLGRKGIRQTIGLTGTGLFATKYTPWSEVRGEASSDAGAGSGEAGREVTPAELAAESVGMAVPPSPQTRCDFCGAQAVHGQRCPMCNQPV